MDTKRKRFTAEEKVKLLRLHLVEKEPVLDLCDRHGLNPNVFYHWQKQFFENGTAAFEQAGAGRKDGQVKRKVPGQSLTSVMKSSITSVTDL